MTSCTCIAQPRGPFLRSLGLNPVCGRKVLVARQTSKVFSRQKAGEPLLQLVSLHRTLAQRAQPRGGSHSTISAPGWLPERRLLLGHHPSDRTEFDALLKHQQRLVPAELVSTYCRMWRQAWNSTLSFLQDRIDAWAHLRGLPITNRCNKLNDSRRVMGSIRATSASGLRAKLQRLGSPTILRRHLTTEIVGSRFSCLSDGWVLDAADQYGVCLAQLSLGVC